MPAEKCLHYISLIGTQKPLVFLPTRKEFSTKHKKLLMLPKQQKIDPKK